jgi:1,4-dihydroxy-2-naphthoate octaprenyltransferase
MSEDLVVLRSARNAFLVLLVLLLAVGVVQFVAGDGVTGPVGGLWVAGVVVYTGSKYYYRWRSETGEVTVDPG